MFKQTLEWIGLTKKNLLLNKKVEEAILINQPTPKNNE
jgi:hypothetical protein